MNLKLVIGLLTVLVLTACSEAPPCPDFKASPVVTSAGCVAYQGQSLLLVQGQNDAVSVPGGSANQGESGRCAAFRETWEETGLVVEPKQLIRTFDNGFHLYHCNVAQWPETFSPPFRLEIKQVLLLDRADFDQHSWRFPDQQQWLSEWLQGVVKE
jgi:ADP-ribose pyrophosphatase YjhB (NUDIX family)